MVRAGLLWSKRYLDRHPISVGFAAVVLLASLLTGTLWGQDASALGTGPLAVFSAERWWTPLTALIVPSSAIDAAVAILLALTALAYAETLLGRLRLLWVLAVTGLVGVSVAIGIHSALWTITDLRPVEADEVPVLDPVIAIAGAVMAATGIASALWRRRLRLVGFSVLGMFALYAGDADSWYRIASALVGLLVGFVLARTHPQHPWHRSSTRETRSLLAALVAVSGLGPLAAILAGGGRGPFSLVIDAFEQYDQDIIDRCAKVYQPVCDHQVALLVTRGVGPALLALAPLALLLVAALGLRQGRRAGWVLAVAVEGVLAGLALYVLISGRVSIDQWTDGTGLEYVLWGTASIIVPLAMVAALVAARRRFPIRATRRTTRVVAACIAGTFLLCVTVFLVAETLLRRSFDVDPTPIDLFVEALRRFIPPAFLEGIKQTPYPRHGLALFVYQWVGVVFWAVVAGGTVGLYRRPQHPADDDSTLYRDLLRRGGGTLGFLGTWEGNSYWYSADRQCAVAYRLVGDVALAIADPLTPVDRRADTVRAFVDHCIGRGWVPVFYSIHEEFLPVFDEMGWEYTSVGEETVMLLSDLTFEGKAWQKVRQPLTRAEREGVSAVWTRWVDLTPAMVRQIGEIDEQWVADKALPEMGFTLGSLREVKDPDVALLLAVDAQGRIQAVTSWMPSWRNGVRTGWTLDFMRRRADGPNGMMEFVIAKAALQAKSDGIEELSLSGAPLAIKPDAARPASAEPDEPTVMTTLLAWLAAVLEPAYGFASLFRFKSKFRPVYRTIYIAYGDPVELARIGVAVGRAYLPSASGRDVLAVVRGSRENEK